MLSKLRRGNARSFGSTSGCGEGIPKGVSNQVN